MDLRSAHKSPDDPPLPPLPRLRLSLTRSLLPEEEERSLASCRRRETPEQHPGSKTWRSKFTCLHSDPRSPTAEDWEGRGEEEEGEEEDVKEVMAKGTLDGMCQYSSGNWFFPRNTITGENTEYNYRCYLKKKYKKDYKTIMIIT